MDKYSLYEKEQRKIARKIANSPYPLVDMTRISEEALKEQEDFGLMGRVLKHIHDPDIVPFFKSIREDLKELEAKGEEEYVLKTLSSIYEAGNVKNEQGLLTAASECFATTKEDKAMTVADILTAKGREEGIQKGVLKGKIDIVLSMLKENLSVEAISRMSQLPKSKILELKGSMNA